MVGQEQVPRRGFLKKGLLGGALLVVGGTTALALRRGRIARSPRSALRLLSPAEHATFAAIAARVVPGDGAGPKWPTAEALDCAGKADALMALAHPEVQRDFRRLLALFDNGLVGLLFGGSPSPFTRLPPAEQDGRLEAWRTSSLALLQSGYQALVRLASATYYSSPEVYALVGYPGPPDIPAEAR